jgi:hypothetical protein
VMKTSICGHGMLLFIGVLLLDRAQQDDGPDAISNRTLNPVSVGAWWIFDWRMVDFRLARGEFGSARSSRGRQVRRGFCRPLGHTGPQARKGEGGRLGRSASAGSRAEKKKKEGGLGWLQGELGFGPSPSRI